MRCDNRTQSSGIPNYPCLMRYHTEVGCLCYFGRLEDRVLTEILYLLRYDMTKHEQNVRISVWVDFGFSRYGLEAAACETRFHLEVSIFFTPARTHDLRLWLPRPHHRGVIGSLPWR